MDSMSGQAADAAAGGDWVMRVIAPRRDPEWVGGAIKAMLYERVKHCCLSKVSIGISGCPPGQSAPARPATSAYMPPRLGKCANIRPMKAQTANKLLQLVAIALLSAGVASCSLKADPQLMSWLFISGAGLYTACRLYAWLRRSD